MANDFELLVETFTYLKAMGAPRDQAEDFLEFDSDQTPPPLALIRQALNLVYGGAE
jgi:hypothetical protein